LVRAAYGPALRAYEAFYRSWLALTAAVHAGEAAEVLGRSVDAARLTTLLTKLIDAVDAFQTAMATLEVAAKGDP
jgi:hypothetical protein